MLEVKKCYVNSNYISDYWENNLIIDQSELLNNKIELDFNYIEYLDEEKEKLNNYCKDINSKNNNEFNTKYNNNFRNTKTSKSDNRERKSENIFRGEYNRNKNSNPGMYNQEKSCEHRTFPKYSDTSEDKRKMHDLSKKCRLHEHYNGKTKILLDSFSKSKLA